MKFKFARITLISLCILFAASCSNTKFLQEGTSLVKKNKINFHASVKVKKNSSEDIESSLLGLCKQKPNKKKFFFFKLPLYFYNKANKVLYSTKSKSQLTKQIDSWIIDHLGEEPVLFDSTLMEYSAQQMKTFLFNEGYLKNEVAFHFKTRRKRTSVTYEINPGTKYFFGSTFYHTDSSGLNKLFQQASINSEIKRGEGFSTSTLQLEQLRLTKLFLDSGYFHFTKDLVDFGMDTTGRNDSVDIHITLKKTIGTLSRICYTVNEVVIFPDYNSENKFKYRVGDTTEFNDFVFITDTLVVKPKAIAKAIFILKGEEYSRSHYDYTIARLTDLGVFKFISIQFQESDSAKLDCIIRLIPGRRRKIGLDNDVNNVEGNNLGVSSKFSFSNQNLYHTASKANFNANAGIEIPTSKLDTSLLFNVNVSAGWAIPGYIGCPLNTKNWSRFSNPKTKINISFQFLHQTNAYSLSSYNTSFGWDFVKAKSMNPEISKRFIINWAVLSLVIPGNLSPSFIDKLKKDEILRQSFSEQFIPAGNFSYVTSTQPIHRQHFSYFKGGVEFSGNTFLAGIKIAQLLGSPIQKDLLGHYRVQGQIFSNYTKMEIDYRRYYLFKKKKSFAARLNIGYGIPYGNSTTLPYIKQYYVGGSSDLRAWRVRSIGPGIFIPDPTTEFFNETGDIKIETNAEYRFNLGGVFRGAFFLDAGNVWLAKPDATKPGGEFHFIGAYSFINQLAIGTGFGLRMDFSFLIFRFDLGIPLRDPSVKKGEEWVYKTFNPINSAWRKNNLVLNLAVAYPF